MPLEKGSRLGAFEIIGLIGAGGMGQVYRARDTRLDRDVAIKVLPDSIVHDPDRLARFEREGRVLAALNHPLIAHVYGFEQSGDTRAIVMELVEGSTLEQRLAQGPIPVVDALRIARQIAEALETAHELGIIHRDLKPANIKLAMPGSSPGRSADGRPARGLAPDDVEDCTVKVLDFGLAKAVDTVSGPAGDALNSPTLTNRATEIGTVLGTAAYMAPEQARGKAVDRRADVWAFGVVLYEMLTGARLFKGEDISDTMAAVLRQPITFAALPPATPPAVRTLLERCLERDPRQRLRDIGEARVALDHVIAGPPAADTVAASVAGPSASGARTWLPWLLFAAAATALAVVLGPWARPSSSGSSGPGATARVTRLVSTIGVPGSLVVDSGPAAVLSPDGRVIVLRVRHEGMTRLYVRRLDEITPTELPGTDNAANPFFSPDGSRIGFFASGGLKTMPLAGGATTNLADAANLRGAAWDENGEILFQPSLFFKTPLVRITGAGTPTDRGTTLAPDETTHRWPQILPGGKVLYSAHSDVANWDGAVLRVETTPGTPGQVVLQGAYHGRYVPTGHLLYVHSGILYAVRFDLERLSVTSAPVPIVDHLAATPVSGGAQYTFASDGTLVYVPGSAHAADARIHWMTSTGDVTPLKTTPGTWGSPRFSPDGERLALQVTSGRHDQIAIYDLKSDRLTQLTSGEANNRHPIWTPDGQRIVYASDADRAGVLNLYWRRADGTGQAQRLTDRPESQVVNSIHPKGRYILYTESTNTTDQWLLPLDGDEARGWTPGTPRALAITPALEGLGAFSPDGQFVAYMSSESVSFEIFVKPVEGTGGPWRVSSNGGAHPTWSKTTNELLFNSGDQIMSVRYESDGRTFKSEMPKPWSPLRVATAGPTRKYDLHPDGQRVVVASPTATGPTAHDSVVFVINFFDELRRLLPPER